MFLQKILYIFRNLYLINKNSPFALSLSKGTARSFSKILDLIYPVTCRECGIFIESKDIFCSDCDKKIIPIVSRFVAVSEKYSLKIIAISDYKPPIKNLILKKFQDDLLASKQLGKLAALKTSLNRVHIDYIIPVPLHWTRYASRGFNQASVMAREIGKELRVDVLDILQRSRRTTFQSTLKGKEKEKNVAGAFKIKRKYQKIAFELFKNKRILFVDDLTTSGATLKNVAKCFVAFKPNSLIAFVAARKC